MIKILPDADECNNEGNDITEHMETVCYKSHGVGDVADHELHHHVAGGQEHHADQLVRRAAVLHPDSDISHQRHTHIIMDRRQ